MDAKECEIIAPEGFEHHCISEALLAGNAMGRRSMYQFGGTLPKDSKGAFDMGLSAGATRGTISFIRPTITISQFPVEILNIDGVEIQFQLVPDTEAPSEMNFYFPKFRVLDLPETAVHGVSLSLLFGS